MDRSTVKGWMKLSNWAASTMYAMMMPSSEGEHEVLEGLTHGVGRALVPAPIYSAVQHLAPRWRRGRPLPCPGVCSRGWRNTVMALCRSTRLMMLGPPPSCILTTLESSTSLPVLGPDVELAMSSRVHPVCRVEPDPDIVAPALCLVLELGDVDLAADQEIDRLGDGGYAHAQVGRLVPVDEDADLRFARLPARCPRRRSREVLRILRRSPWQ